MSASNEAKSKMNQINTIHIYIKGCPEGSYDPPSELTWGVGHDFKHASTCVLVTDIL